MSNGLVTECCVHSAQGPANGRIPVMVSVLIDYYPMAASEVMPSRCTLLFHMHKHSPSTVSTTTCDTTSSPDTEYPLD
jgi:hypothetical protein